MGNLRSVYQAFHHVAPDDNVLIAHQPEEIHSADDRHHTQERRGPRSQHGIYTDENFIYFPKNKSGKKHGCKLRPIARLTIAICLITRLTIQKWLIIKVFLTRDSPRGRVTWVWSITFMTQLLLSLGLDHALCDSSTNVKWGPRFAEIFHHALLSVFSQAEFLLLNKCWSKWVTWHIGMSGAL